MHSSIAVIDESFPIEKHNAEAAGLDLWVWYGVISYMYNTYLHINIYYMYIYSLSLYIYMFRISTFSFSIISTFSLSLLRIADVQVDDNADLLDLNFDSPKVEAPSVSR